jgi:hypothetical protein
MSDGVLRRSCCDDSLTERWGVEDGLRLSAGLELLDGDGIHDLVVVRLCPGQGSARLMVAQSKGVQGATHPKRQRFLSTLGYEAARVQFIYRHLGSCLVDLDFLPLRLVRVKTIWWLHLL